MNRSLRNITRSLLLILSASGLVACGSSQSNPGGTGGVGGSGAGTPAGGIAGSSAAGGATSPKGGSSGATTSTTASTGTDGKMCPPPQALITDFTSSHFGDATTLAGGEYVYPTTGTYPLTSDLSEGNWHISGTVGDYSGFGLYFDTCNRIDASAYAGISFKISGTVEQEGAVTLQVDTLNNTITAAWLNAHGGSANVTDPGRCEPPASAANQWAQSTCANPTQAIPVTATPTAQSILWSDFSGGKPDANVAPSDIVSIHWLLPNPPGAGTASPEPYKVDITIDDLSFIPK